MILETRSEDRRRLVCMADGYHQLEVLVATGTVAWLGQSCHW